MNHLLFLTGTPIQTRTGNLKARNLLLYPIGAIGVYNIYIAHTLHMHQMKYTIYIPIRKNLKKALNFIIKFFYFRTNLI